MNFDINNLNAVVKFVRILGEIDFSPVMRSKAKLANLAHYANLGFPKVDASGLVTSPSPPEGIELARLILGDDFISYEEVAKAYCFAYSLEQIESLESSLPSLEILTWMKSNSYTLMATPPSAINLLDVRTLDPPLFYSKKGGWYTKEEQKFSRDETLQIGSWLAIRKDVVPNSLSQNWDEQQNLLKSVEHVPMACELTYVIVTYYKVRGLRLYEHLYPRTSSVSADGDRVFLCVFDGSGLFVDGCGGDFRHGLLGLSSSRKV